MASDVRIPTIIIELQSHVISTIACGGSFTVAVTGKQNQAPLMIISDFGRVYSWGCGTHGCLGNGSEEGRAKPELVAALKDDQIVSLAAGHAHVLAASEFRVFSWGWNASGQLGNGSTVNSLVPLEIESLSGVQILSLSCGYAHSAVLAQLDVGGSPAYLWGNNDYVRHQHCFIH